MLTLHTEILINASPKDVWAVLADTTRHAEWNPFMKKMQGSLRVGETLTVQLAPPGGKSMQFRPRLLVVDPEKELRWLGRVLMPGLFDGEHYFLLEPNTAGGTRFIHGERFSGLLVGFLKKSLETGTKAGFEAMNAALKARVESK